MGCRTRAAKFELLRVVARADGTLVVDSRGRLPGRGAHIHPDPACVDLAERRKAFPRALRLPGPVDLSPIRRFLEHHQTEGS
ncbi:MAG TPA: YlxR family protein [Frankiaceae bacterium]|nr:YlxR family protein [Frankiaceae bacterium]